MTNQTDSQRAPAGQPARPQVISRRGFLRALCALPAGAALLEACGTSTGSSATAPPAAPTTAPTTSAPAAALATAPATSAPAATAGQGLTPRVVAAANAFLATLSDSEKSSVLFDWSDTAQKQRWSNLPEGLYTRAGLMWGNLGEAPQNAWLQLMQATLSSQGYNRVLAEWNADDQLTSQSGAAPGGAPPGGTPPAGGTPGARPGDGGGPGGQLLYGKKYYWVALIGTPSETQPWQWQWGGHHVTINATVAGPNIALTPSFIGVQPGSYTDASGTTIRPLGDIADQALALVSSLDATQQQAAILGSTSIDLVLGPGQDDKTIQPEGLPGAQMNADQQAALLTLIGHYTGLVSDQLAAARLAEVQATLDQTYFAWYGPTTQGGAAYFRISGPTLVIEYAPQGGGGNGLGLGGATSANHIHGIYRDPTNDYGAKYTKS